METTVYVSTVAFWIELQYQPEQSPATTACPSGSWCGTLGRPGATYPDGAAVPGAHFVEPVLAEQVQEGAVGLQEAALVLVDGRLLQDPLVHEGGALDAVPEPVLDLDLSHQDRLHAPLQGVEYGGHLAWLPLLVRMAETACRILPVSPQATTRLKRQAQDSAVMAWPVGSLGPVLRTVVSNSNWKRDSGGRTEEGGRVRRQVEEDL
ncbi:hypothetical protein EYF80_047943 [Liparis tanakae]|uniref:Uncharacterized protein n=1 Tax=Liparis tanakae TaxID=230148 RepID=A0A4Z2FKU6_9TELE|nr:hypothetical protein EYF80_047943 [Liparis tanakae]